MAVNLPIPEAQCPRVVFLILGLKAFLDDSAIDGGSVDVRTLLASLLEEILRGRLLRHCRQQVEQFGRGGKLEYKEEREKPKRWMGRECSGTVEVYLARCHGNALKADCETNGKTIRDVVDR